MHNADPVTYSTALEADAQVGVQYITPQPMYMLGSMLCCCLLQQPGARSRCMISSNLVKAVMSTFCAQCFFPLPRKILCNSLCLTVFVRITLKHLQDYADTLAGACGDLTPDMTLDDTTTWENLSLCLLVADPDDSCSSGKNGLL